MARRWTRAVTVAILVWAAHATARAQAGASAQAAPPASTAEAPNPERDKIARDLFNAGRSAYDSGLFEEALDSFQRAYTLSQRPQLLFNVGQAADRAGREQEALDAFEEYLRRLPEADNRPYVEGRVTILKRSLEQKAAAASVAPAALAPAQQAPAGATQADHGEDGGVITKWWFWTVIGVGVAAVVTTSVLLAGREPDLEQGDVGGVITTLKVAR